ncbi:MAG: ABC transporter ATP-binding protein [Elusimicrobia bacterium]|nr:ABC transporter ATP-binding protein [Elusimicrobiota bacterium]
MKNWHIYKRLFKFLKPYKTRFIEAIIAMVFIAGLTSFRVYLLKPGMDRLIKSKEIKILLFFSLLLIIATVLHATFSYIQAYLLSYIGQKITIDLRNKVYANLQKLSLVYFITRPTGEILSRLTNDIGYIQIALTMVPTKFIRDGLTCISLFGLLLYLNWKWTLFMLLFFPLILYPISVFSRKMRKTALKTQEKIASVYALISEKISGIKVIKAFAQEPREIEKMKKVNQEFFNVMMKLLRTQVLQRPVLEVITYTLSIFLIFFVFYSLFRGVVSAGTATAYIAAMISFYTPIKNLADLNKQIQTALACGERVFELLDKKPDVKESPQPLEFKDFKKSIKFENVSFFYTLKNKALRKIAIKNINFEIKRGEIFAIVGPSGGGKTTIVNLIPRFFDPTNGRITIDGIDIRNFKISSLRKKIGIVTQDVILFNDTIKANIAYGFPKASMEQIKWAAKLANADGFIAELPEKYDTQIGERGATLSGGQAQRICIARAIIGNPPILIFDEATSSLDTESELQIQKAIQNIQKDRTTIVVAHRLSTVRKANKIIVVCDGEIVEEGTHTELLKTGQVYKRLYELQFQA